jgi:two-component system chemotaxis response regulator CheB
MPSSALESTAVDVVAPADRIAEAIVELVQSRSRLVRESEVAEFPSESGGVLVSTICPECGGVLTAADHAGVRQWTCRVGHRYSGESLLEASAAGIEATLWAAIRALEDRHALLALVADGLAGEGSTSVADRLRERADACIEHASDVRITLASAAQSSLRTIADLKVGAHEEID